MAHNLPPVSYCTPAPWMESLSSLPPLMACGKRQGTGVQQTRLNLSPYPSNYFKDGGYYLRSKPVCPVSSAMCRARRNIPSDVYKVSGTRLEKILPLFLTVAMPILLSVKILFSPASSSQH